MMFSILINILCVAKKLLQMKASNFQPLAMTGHNDQMSLKDHASGILRHHYGTLSQCFHYSVDMVQLLHGENVISEAILFATQSLSKDEASFLLLKEVRHAVHTNYHNLEVFARVLLHFENQCIAIQPNFILCANAILKDYGKCMYIVIYCTITLIT